MDEVAGFSSLLIGALCLGCRTSCALTYQGTVIFFCSILPIMKKVVIDVKEGDLWRHWFSFLLINHGSYGKYMWILYKTIAHRNNEGSEWLRITEHLMLLIHAAAADTDLLRKPVTWLPLARFCRARRAMKAAGQIFTKMLLICGSHMLWDRNNRQDVPVSTIVGWTVDVNSVWT